MGASGGANGPLRVARRAVQTRDLELAHELLGETYAAHRPQCSGSRERFRFSLSSIAVGSIASDTLIHSMGTVATAEPVHSLTVGYMAGGRMVVRRGREEAHFGPGDVGLYPYGVGFELRWDVMDQGLVRLDFDKVARLAAETTDADGVRFLGMRPVSADMGRYWLAVTVFVRRELAAASSAITQPLVLDEFETLLAAAALSVFPNTTLTAGASGSPEGHVGPATLRRAVAYIDENAGEAITLTDIAADAGVGARALQRSFAGHYDTTPMGYLRRVRLERAHRELQAGDPARGDSVGRIAQRWGFAKRSRFAENYRRAYGAHPSHTLRT
jgi:AraC-like DNA-binding protein